MIDYDFEVGQEVTFDVSVNHPSYTLMRSVWQRCRDAADGGVVVKAKDEIYLPKLNKSQTPDDYADYKDRAYWYGATGKTVETFVGMIFRKAPLLTLNDDVDEKQKDMFQSITSDNRAYEDVLREIVEEILLVNRVGVLEDFPSMTDDEGNVILMSQLDAEKMKLSSNTAIYPTESIINWKMEEVDGEMVPVYFVLHEVADKDGSTNQLAPDQEDLYRLLYLKPLDNGQVVYQQVLLAPKVNAKKTATGDATSGTKKATSFEVREVVTPIKQNEPLNRIPFWVLNADGLEYNLVETPIIYDLVEVNMAHYRNSADYERELHRVSMKTAIFPGWNADEDGAIEIGGAMATPAGETPFILESTSPSPLNEEMTKKEERMATIGAQLLAQKGRYVQAAETAMIQSRGESSVVASVSRSTGTVMSELFAFKLEWSGIDMAVSVELNTDFDEAPYTAQDLSALMQLLQGGGISFDVYYYAMDKLEMYPSDWTKEKEIAALQETDDVLGSRSNEELDSLMETVLGMQAQMDGQSAAEPDPEEDPEDTEE